MFTDCPPGPGRAEHVDLEIVRVDLDVDVLGLGQHRDRRRARVDATLALGGRHPLHAVRPALVLEQAPGVVALHQERDVAVAAVLRRLARQHLDLQAVALGEVLVHAVEVAGPEVGLLAALGALDLDDDVAALVRVVREQELLDPAFEHRELGFLVGQLRPPGLALGRIGRALEQLPGVGDVLDTCRHSRVRLDDRLQLLLAPARVAGRAPVARGVDAGQVGLEPIELIGERSRAVRTSGRRVPAAPRAPGSKIRTSRISAQGRPRTSVEASGRYGLGTDACQGRRHERTEHQHRVRGA